MHLCLYVCLHVCLIEKVAMLLEAYLRGNMIVVLREEKADYHLSFVGEGFA